MRKHYRFDQGTFTYCTEVFLAPQRDLTGYGVELPSAPEGCQSLQHVSQMIKRRRGL